MEIRGLGSSLTRLAWKYPATFAQHFIDKMLSVYRSLKLAVYKICVTLVRSTKKTTHKVVRGLNWVEFLLPVFVPISEIAEVQIEQNGKPTGRMLLFPGIF